MASFDEILNELHTDGAVVDTDEFIVINKQRQFEIPAQFNTIIAYEGDVNSQIITFECYKNHERHDLSQCGNKELRWKNLGNSLEGTSELKLYTPEIEHSDKFCLQWEVPAEIFSKAGIIEFSITIFDKTDNLTTFSWNTPECSALSVGRTMESVGTNFPAKDEILLLDKETKNIVAPAGYNNVICNFGEIGVAKVYFLTNRYLGRKNDLDVLNSETTLHIIANGWKIKETIASQFVKLYTNELTGRENEGLVFIEWEVPADITANEKYGSGTLQIAVEFSEQTDGAITKRWISNKYSNLTIKESILQIDVTPGPTATTEDLIYELVDNYFLTNEIVFSNNDE